MNSTPIRGVSLPAINKVNIETVHVGNPGNAGELSGSGAGGYGRDRICGAVDYAYNIGKYEVTNAQYREFLNAVAAHGDPYGLYNSSMASSNRGGIQRSGSGTEADPYVYTAKGGDGNWDNRPVNYVSWADAARFANWLANGGAEGSGTETGSYDLTGTHAFYNADGSVNDYDSLRAALLEIPREADATWCIPTEDEWYKAAYYDPDLARYFDYPTGSDSIASNDLINPDPGNNANFYQSGYTIGSPYWLTEVGEFENSESPYDTFDQGGNVWEWNEAVIGSYRGLRGGSYRSYDFGLLASYRSVNYPAYEDYLIGFRVSEVPEPGSMAILALGAVGMLRRRRNVRG